ncbi:helix-turn-helix domain-containing protein [Streptomyces sp. NPDC057757]|uniref:helix-turn-helix domain-containing protein n=1 Tax=Streptomyces sp. NPDC057757 TaxID=3346241 RepID=UPI0036B46BF9
MHREPPPPWVLTRRRAIGVQLRNARKAAGLTQQQLGERIDRDVKSISRWENGRRPPDLNDLIVLADGMGVPLTELVK